jgi:hypothetical protein
VYALEVDPFIMPIQAKDIQGIVMSVDDFTRALSTGSR